MIDNLLQGIFRDVFDIRDDKAVEYYLLARAKNLGADNQTLKRRLKELGRSLSNERRRELDQKARLKEALIRSIFDEMQPL